MKSAEATTQARRATWALLVVTVVWGLTFIWMKQALLAGEEVYGPDHTGVVTFLFLGLRFAAAAALLFCLRACRRIGGTGTLLAGVLMGTILLAGFLLQMFGLADVSPPVSAFLTSLYVLFTALLQIFFGKRRAHLRLWIGVLLATLGAGLINGPPKMAGSRGEWLTILSAFVFALHILAIDRLTKRYAALPLTAISLAVVGLACGLGFVTLSSDLAKAQELLLHPGFLQPLVLSCLLATVFAMSVMNLYQKYLGPERAAVLYALEPIWAALGALYLGLEEPRAWLFIGGGLLLLGNLVCEWRKEPASG